MSLVKWRPIADLAEKWDPYHDILNMEKEMNRMLGNFFGDLRKSRNTFDWHPEINIINRKKEFVVEAELPGLKKEDINISLHDNVLTIHGELKRETEENDESYYLAERRYGSFSRSVRIPEEVKEDKITATYKDGVLKVTLPKTERAAKELKINIK